MIREEAIDKLVSVRHCCFVRGILGRSKDADFRQAFLTVNRLYVRLRDSVKGLSDARIRSLARRRKAA
jgi:hypothetical protein